MMGVCVCVRVRVCASACERESVCGRSQRSGQLHSGNRSEKRQREERNWRTGFPQRALKVAEEQLQHSTALY